MMDVDLLGKAMQKQRVGRREMARQLGISEDGLSRKMNNETEFRASEIKRIAQLLHLPFEWKRRIFFDD